MEDLLSCNEDPTNEVTDSRIFVHFPGQPAHGFEQWLSKYLPSRRCAEEDEGWIFVLHGQDPGKFRFDENDEPLHASFQNLVSNKNVNLETISNLARETNTTLGKWLFYVENGPKADLMWSIVARAVVGGLIPSVEARIDPYLKNGQSDHVVCVYNDNFLDTEQVFECEKGLRKIGIKCPLLYKPDIYTKLGIYARNEWGLKPTIYRSEYDIISRTSVIM